MSKKVSRNTEITEQFLQLVQQNLRDMYAGKAEKRFHAQDFAAEMFLSKIHLSNTIHLTTGKSPCDFMEEGILTQAQRLLRETDLSIADIAYRFVYNDPGNFTRFFKGMCGMTPKEYRKQLIISN